MAVPLESPLYREDREDGYLYYKIYFYYQDKKTCVVTHLQDSHLTLISLFPEGSENARAINSEIKGSEKKAVLKEFEERILNPIKGILKR
jgi:hypothetical protein